MKLIKTHTYKSDMMKIIHLTDTHLGAEGNLIYDLDPLSGNRQGTSFTTLRATNHQVSLDFKATKNIPGSHEPPAYAIAFIHPETIVVHFHDYLDDSPRYFMNDSPTIA